MNNGVYCPQFTESTLTQSSEHPHFGLSEKLLELAYMQVIQEMNGVGGPTGGMILNITRVRS